MNSKMDRREFLTAAPAAAWGLSRIAQGSQGVKAPTPSSSSLIKIEPFEYRGVRLRESRQLDQFLSAREFYLGLNEDDVLKGFRAAVGLPAPGHGLSGWAARSAGGIFGQWLSGFSRMYRANGDGAAREKAVRLVTEFAKTVKSDGDCGQRHYAFDKLVCGLVDLQLYADHQDAIVFLEKICDWASKNFNHDNIPAIPMPKGAYQGRPSEWYTLGENLFRAYQLTGNPKFKSFAETWLYPAYWNKFADTAAPSDAYGGHAYSHVNTFSSAAMAYAVSGDPSYLRIIKNAYDYHQNTQCYATGGYGPNEAIAKPDGGLGRALEFRSDCFETPCGSWAAIKLSRYLQQFTGEARYGDWIERLLYNGIGAALPITTGGKNYYYSDYRLSGGMRVYNWENFTCCSGTYIQDVVDYHNQIYYKDAKSLYVNLFVPSEVVWSRPDGDVKLVQETRYPEAETSALTLDMKQKTSFALKFRVPGWSRNVGVKVNGAPADVGCIPGTWAVLDRAWSPGDRVEVRIPLRFRMEAVDKAHPNWIAVVRGPIVFVQDNTHSNPLFLMPATEEELDRGLVPEDAPGVPPGLFRLTTVGGRIETLRFWPYYAVPELYSYRMYFDLKRGPLAIW